MKVLNMIKLILLPFGICLMAGALFWYLSISGFVAEAERAEGKVIELLRRTDSSTYAPVVSFITKNGESIEFVSSTGSNPPSYSVGETVPVLYAPASPQNARIDGILSLWAGPMILGGIGIGFSSLAFSMLLVGRVGTRRKQYLLRHGVPIDTEFQGVQLNSSLKINGISPYCILTQWQNPETSEIHVFESEHLWFDPTDYIDRSQIRVFIEQDNPRKYHVDVSFLPKLA